MAVRPATGIARRETEMSPLSGIVHKNAIRIGTLEVVPRNWENKITMARNPMSSAWPLLLDRKPMAPLIFSIAVVRCMALMATNIPAIISVVVVTMLNASLSSSTPVT